MNYAYQGKHPPTQLAAMNEDIKTKEWLAMLPNILIVQTRWE